LSISQIGKVFAPNQVVGLVLTCAITLNDLEAIAITGGKLNNMYVRKLF